MSIVVAVARARFGVVAVDTRHMFYPPGGAPVHMDCGKKLLWWGSPQRRFFSAATGRYEKGASVFRLLAEKNAETVEEGRLWAAVAAEAPAGGKDRTHVFTLGPGDSGGPAIELWDMVGGEAFHQPMLVRPDQPSYAITRPKGLAPEQLAGIDAAFRAQLAAAHDQPGVLRAVGAAVLAAARLTDTVSTTVDLGLWHARGGLPLRFEARDLARLGLPGGLPWAQATVQTAHDAYRADMARDVDIDLSRLPHEMVSDFEFAFNNWGVRTKVSDVCPGIGPLKDGEVLYIAGYAFNTASTNAAAQEAAERSEVIRASISVGALKNRVITAEITTVLAADDSTFSGWAFALDIAVDSGVRSLKIEVGSFLSIDDSGPPPWSPATPSTPYSYTVDLTGPTSHQARLKDYDGSTDLVVGKQGGTSITLTPYPEASGAGTAGAPVVIALPNTLSTTGTGAGVAVQDEDGSGSALGVLGADRLRIGQYLSVDTTGGRPRVKLNLTLGTGPCPSLAEGELYGRYVP